MTKWQEEDLLQDIHKAVKIFERFVSVLEKTNDRKKVEVIRCEDCVYWKNRMRIFCGDTDADFFCGHAVRKQV